MKIAFLHYTCGLIERGSEISTQLLANYLAKRRHEICLYQLGNVRPKTNFKIIKIKLPLKPHLFKSTNFLGKMLERIYLDYNSLIILLFSFKSFTKLIKFKPDIIIPTNGFWQIIICKILQLIFKTKIVVIGRAGIGWTDRDNLRLSPDLFIALTEEAKDWAKVVNSKTRVTYLPNAIDLSSFLNNEVPIKIPLKKPIILTVAALTAYKHIDKLIEACSKLDNVSLLVVGEGELFSQLNKSGKEKLGDRFAIITFKQSQMPSVYKACQLFVLLSDEREAFGRVFLEAMACGLSIVTMNSTARRNIIGPSGIFINSLVITSLAAALKKGLNEKVSRELIKQAKTFDINTIGLDYEKALMELAG